MEASHSTKLKKEEALRLIKKGLTYSAIQQKYGTPKSTLSYWANSQGLARDRSKQLAHLAVARKAAVTSLQEKKKARLALALKEAEEISLELSIDKEGVGKSLLAMLYWAEGGKQEGNMKFTNTDSELVQLFLCLLRRNYKIDESRIRVGLQIHSYHNKAETIKFWSEKLQVPPTQFWKLYIKPRSGLKKQYRRNFYGICNVHYSSSAIQRELLALGKCIAEKAAL